MRNRPPAIAVPVLVVLSLSLGACSEDPTRVMPEIAPICRYWGDMRSSIVAGEPIPTPATSYLSDEPVRQQTPQEFQSRALDLAVHLQSFLMTGFQTGEPPSDELVSSAQEFETYCADHGAPISGDGLETLA